MLGLVYIRLNSHFSENDFTHSFLAKKKGMLWVHRNNSVKFTRKGEHFFFARNSLQNCISTICQQIFCKDTLEKDGYSELQNHDLMQFRKWGDDFRLWTSMQILFFFARMSLKISMPWDFLIFDSKKGAIAWGYKTIGARRSRQEYCGIVRNLQNLIEAHETLSGKFVAFI